MPGSYIQYELEKKISDKQTLKPYTQQIICFQHLIIFNCITYKAQLDTRYYTTKGEISAS